MKKIFITVFFFTAFNLQAAPKVIYDTAYGVTSTQATEQYAVFGMFDGNIRLVDAKTSEIILLDNAHKKPIISMTVTKDGRYLASASQDDVIIIWDLAKQKDIKRIVKPGMGVRAAAFNHDGSRLFIAYPWQIFEYDTNSWANTGLYDGFTKGIYSIAVNGQGNKIAVGTKHGDIDILDLKKGEVVETYKAGRELIISLDYAETEDILAAGSYDKSVRLFRKGKSRAYKEFSFFTDTVRGVKLNRQGSMVAAASDDGSVVVYDLKRNKTYKQEIEEKGEVTSLSAPKSFNFIVTGKGTAFEEERYGIITYMSNKFLYRKLYSFRTSDIIIAENNKIEARGSFGEYIRVYEKGNKGDVFDYMGISQVNF